MLAVQHTSGVAYSLLTWSMPLPDRVYATAASAVVAVLLLCSVTHGWGPGVLPLQQHSPEL